MPHQNPSAMVLCRDGFPEEAPVRTSRSLSPPVLLLLMALAAGCATPENGADDGTSAEADWRPLFDGTSFAGWRGLGRDSIPTAHWVIEDGMIRKVASGAVPTAADGQPLAGGDIMTIDTFTDFELSFEWKVSPGGNSGIKYNVSEALSTSSPPSRCRPSR